MKKITLTILTAILSIMTFAQNGNLVVFSEGGERFTLILNGIKHNNSPETNVKVEDNEWQSVFSAVVDPMPRLLSAVLPQMIERQSGKILVMGSASSSGSTLWATIPSMKPSFLSFMRWPDSSFLPVVRSAMQWQAPGTRLYA